MRLLTVLASAFILSIGSAYAGCTKPSGVYVGSGAGSVYSGPSYTVTAIQLSVNIPTTGKWVFSSWIKSQNFGAQSVSFKAPAIGSPGNKFDQNTCRGQVTTESVAGNAYVFSYVVSNDGNNMSFINFDSTQAISDFVISLGKV